MYGIKGYIFIDKLGRLEISNPPFEAMTDYEKGHEYMNVQKETLTSVLPADVSITGYMFTLIPKEKWKEEE